MLIFVTVALLIYSVINFYILRWGWQALSGTGIVRAVLLCIFLPLVLAFPVGRSAESLLPGKISEIFIYLGSLYLALMLYLFLLILLIDIVRLLNVFLRFFPKALTNNQPQAGQAAFVLVLSAALSFVVYGYFNAWQLRLRSLDLKVNKPAGQLQSLKIAMASDIHLGLMISCSRLEKIVRRINELELDIVLLPGDIVDESVSAEVEERMAGILKEIQAPLGVYAVPGNHEYYSGLERSLEYLRRGNVAVLQDRAVKIADSFYLAGRKDLSAQRMGDERKTLREILAGVDPKLPLILLDHQPLHLEEAEENGVDLQVSGHTHNGQLFPLNLVNKAVYEKNWGYLRKGDTHYYISCGAGTWGPPVRTASVAEIIQVRLTFRSQSPSGSSIRKERKPDTLSTRLPEGANRHGDLFLIIRTAPESGFSHSPVNLTHQV